MDSKQSPAAPPPHLHQQAHRQPPPQSGSMSGPPPQQPQPNPYTHTTTLQNPRFPFNSISTSGPQPPLDYGDSSPPSSGFGSSSGPFSIERGTKKRGRPRKYSPDGCNNIALGLAPTPVTTISAVSGHADSDGGTLLVPSTKQRGRPAGLGKKQLDALGPPGVGFTPHVILINAGEDILSKIMTFSQQGPRTICILSANGAICNVTLRQSAMSGGTVTYEGRFQIICLTGSFPLTESNDNHSRSSGLSVSLAGSDGRVLGGSVAGTLTAATPVQVIVGSFIEDGKKLNSGLSPATPSTNMLNFGVSVAGASPSPQGTSSESSDENGNNHLNHGSRPYGYATQPIQNMLTYTHMGWPNNTVKILPH